MYIFLTAGHPMYAGAKGILDETVVDRAVSLELASILRSMGHTVKYYNSENIKDYVVETSMANQENFDWYIDIHCNASNGQGHGTETLVYTDNKPQAHKISANISKLGFYNRGVKTRTNLYILKHTNAKALLVECFFIDNKTDCDLYNKVGPHAIAKAIAEGLTGTTSTSTIPTPSPAPTPTPTPAPVKPSGNDWIKRLQAELNKQGFRDSNGNTLVVDGIAGSKTLSACPLLREGARGNITKLVQEKLTNLGYSTNGVDGIFGSGTKSAVIKYQRAKGLSADGIVGQNTWRKLLNL